MKKKFTTTIDEDLILKFKIIALEKNTSVSDIIQELMREYLKGNIKLDVVEEEKK